MKYESEKYEDVFSYRVIDRTNEFTSIVKYSDNKKQSSQSKRTRQTKFTDFLNVSKKTSRDLAQTNEKLESLNLILAHEGNEGRVASLQGVIKQDITALKKDLEKLEQYVKKQTAYTKQSRLHLQAIVLSLQTRLVSISSEFKDSLQNQKQLLTTSKTSSSGKQGTLHNNKSHQDQHFERNAYQSYKQHITNNYNQQQQSTNNYNQQFTTNYNQQQQSNNNYNQQQQQGTFQQVFEPHRRHKYHGNIAQQNPLLNQNFQNHNNQPHLYNNQNPSLSYPAQSYPNPSNPVQSYPNTSNPVQSHHAQSYPVPSHHPPSHFTQQNTLQNTALNFETSQHTINTYAPQQQMLRQRRGGEEVARGEDEVGAIEQTIVELGGIFQQLATMVQEQADVVCRIDSNVDEGSVNIEEGHGELVKYFRSVSKMRSLMLKIFIILIAIFVLFSYMLS